MSASQTCSTCGRPVGERGCFHCGIDVGLGASGERGPAREMAFTQGATLVRFLVASAVLLPLGAAWTRSAIETGDRGSLGLAVASFVLGPLVLLVQLVRRAGSTVRVRGR